RIPFVEHALCPGHAHLAQNHFHFVLFQGDGFDPAAHEAGNTWRVANHIPRIVAHDHFHQHIAWKDLALGDLFLTVLVLHHFFHGHDDLEDLVFHLHRLDPLLKVGLYLILIARVCVHNIPVFFRICLLTHGVPTKALVLPS